MLDIGSGYDGAARYLAERYEYLVDCLNISETQNRRNEKLIDAQKLSGAVRVYRGDFQAMPFENETYDALWSQDAMVHGSDREAIFQEADRGIILFI